MRLSSIKTYLLIIASLSLPMLCAASQKDIEELNLLHRDLGQSIDTAYYNAGTVVDVIGFDLEELLKQGKDVPASLVEEVEQAGSDMRSRWLELERKRVQVAEELRCIPLSGNHIIKIYDLVDSGETQSGWFGFRSVKLVWKDGSEVEIPLKSFRNGVYTENYNYLCDASNAVFVYGKRSTQNVVAAGFDIEKLPNGSAKLVISGLDNDKPSVTEIVIEINGQKIFEGRNPYKKYGWSEHSFSVKSGVFENYSVSVDEAVANLKKEFKTLISDAATFGVWADNLKTKIESKTSGLREGLVYSSVDYPDDWLEKGFLRGVCFESNYKYDFPGPVNCGNTYYDNFEYFAKAMRHVGCNLIYQYNKGEAYHRLSAEIDKLNIPMVKSGWGWETQQRGPWVKDQGPWRFRDQRYYANKEAHLADGLDYIKAVGKGHRSFRGLVVDEPVIDEASHTNLNILDDEVVLKKFANYLKTKEEYLAQNGVKVPQDYKPVTKLGDEADMPIYMEWQYFKKMLMARHYDWLYSEMKDNGWFMLPIIMNRNVCDPELCSHVSMSSLPIISTDLYHNGTIVEGLMMQLLHNSAANKAIITTGAGYSCLSPDRFRRSLAVGMMHSDGILQWIDVYSSKYRNPRYFWRFGKDGYLADDRGRNMLSNWSPEYWDIQTDMFAKIQKAQEYLVDAESVATILYLRSERTTLAAQVADKVNYHKDTLGLYSDLIDMHLPMDACYVEKLTKEMLAKYKVVVLPQARTMSAHEVSLIRDWVKDGGVLVATADSSLSDEWGRNIKEFALSDVFGASFVENAKGAKSFKCSKAVVKYDETLSYAKVKLNGNAQVKAKYDNGDIAVVFNRFGKGKCWFLTASRVGKRVSSQPSDSALYYVGLKGMDDFVRNLIKKESGKNPVDVMLPEGVEYQLRYKDGKYIVHLLDWHDSRQLNDVRIRVNESGKWNVVDPFTGEQNIINGKVYKTPGFHLYKMLVLEK